LDTVQDQEETNMLGPINLESDTPIYVQVKNQVLFAIADGRLTPGDALPTVNKVATETGVNMNTVGKAYRDLEVMGLVKARRGRGFFVLNEAPDLCRERVRPDIVERLYTRIREAMAAGLSSNDIQELVRLSATDTNSPYTPISPSVAKASHAFLRKG
jgi:GntR family transcriptional regulator